MDEAQLKKESEFKNLEEKKLKLEKLREMNDRIAVYEDDKQDLRQRQFRNQKLNSVEVKINPKAMGQDIVITNDKGL